MGKKESIVPQTRQELVVPVGRVKVKAKPEEIEQAKRAAEKILNNYEVIFTDVDTGEELARKAPNEKTMKEEVEALSTTEEASEEEALVELSEEAVAALPAAKYGRDKYGRSLNKDGTPRKARNDKGNKRGPRSKGLRCQAQPDGSIKCGV